MNLDVWLDWASICKHNQPLILEMWIDSRFWIN